MDALHAFLALALFASGYGFGWLNKRLPEPQKRDSKGRYVKR